MVCVVRPGVYGLWVEIWCSSEYGVVELVPEAYGLATSTQFLNPRSLVATDFACFLRSV